MICFSVRCDRTLWTSSFFASSTSAQYKHQDQECEHCVVRIHFSSLAHNKHELDETRFAWNLCSFGAVAKRRLSTRQIFKFLNWMKPFIGICILIVYSWLLLSIPWAAYFALDSIDLNWFAVKMVCTLRSKKKPHILLKITTDAKWWLMTFHCKQKKSSWFVTNVRAVWNVTSQTSHHCHID